MRTPIVVIALSSLLATACGSNGASSGTPAGPLADVARSPLERERADVGAEAMAALVDGQMTFAFDLHRAAISDEPNFFFSPVSIHIAFAMLRAGAAGNTAAELDRALRFSLAGDDLHAAIGRLDLDLNSRGEGARGTDDQPFRLNVVNAAWGQRNYVFLDAYLDRLARWYGAGMRLLDFAGAPEPSRTTINDWVAGKTNDLIPELLPAGSIAAATRLVLTNAVYFNAAWDSQFEPRDTAPAAFTLLDGSAKNVAMMRQVTPLPVARLPGLTAVVLPYDGREVEMLVLVPDAGAFARIEAEAGPELLAAVDAALVPTRTELWLPSFGVSTSLDLVGPLQSLGLVDAFVAGAADLSGINGGHDLFVSGAFHQAVVEVDETGTEAAAATAIVVGETSVPPPPLPVHVDRPFLFLIRDVATRAVVFIGRVTDPAA